jgi:hypothetical protein
MINNIRNTVLSILNKDNRGYIGPEEFNQYSRQAQLEIYEKYFYDYTKVVNERNHGKIYTVIAPGSEYADIPAQLAEVIDSFVTTTSLVYNGTTLKFYKPGENPANLIEPKAFSLDRLIYNNGPEVEKSSRSKIINLNNSLVAPSTLYPVYTIDNQGIKVYPTSIVTNISADYIRYPNPPKWTYTSLSGGEPIFNQSSVDYQDFELPERDEMNLIVKILQYAGVSIREMDVVKIAKQEELQNNQDK